MAASPSSVLHVPRFIGDDEVIEGSKDVVLLARPTWKRESLQSTVFTQGITNKLVGMYADEKDDMLLVRVYGHKSELMIDRQREVINLQFLEKHGCCAPLYATFENGICYGFVPGRPLDVKNVKEMPVVRLVVQSMVRLHSVPVEENAEASLFPTLHKWMEILPRSFPDEEKQKRFVSELPSFEELQTELAMLEMRLKALNSPVVFCHNDLLLGNLIYNQQAELVSFIDFEYGAYNYRGFDIGNHFAEYAGLDEVDYSRYPGKEHQLQWLRCYLEETARHHGSPLPSDADVLRLYVEANQFALAAHFFWGLWAILQAANSDLDFDFLGYSKMRLGEYFSRKTEFFNLTA